MDDNVSFGSGQALASAIKGGSLYKANTTSYTIGRVAGDIGSLLWGIGNISAGTTETLAGIAGTSATGGAALGLSAVGVGQIGYGSSVFGNASANLLDDTNTLFAKLKNAGSSGTGSQEKKLSRAQEFEKSLSNLKYNERRAKIIEYLGDIARNRWVEKRALKTKNGRSVFYDSKNNKYYTIDELHGRFEKFDRKGNHEGEYDIDGNFIEGSIDYSGQHNIIVK